MSNNDTIPEGHMRNAQGHLVPISMVRDIDQERDRLVRDLVLSARDASAVLKHLKQLAFGDIAAFVQLSAEQYEVKIGGDKGNITLHSFDGSLKIVRQIQEQLTFDERLQAAKALIDECITEWAENARPEIKVLVNDAFQVNKQGAVQTDRVLSLRRLKIQDEKWLRAMDAISESLQVVGSKPYVRFYERVGDTDQYRAIPLDLASV
ncbi:UNVERIFIED_ORG: DUF3164 family protein [Shinella sp. XGS7]|nr:DUF3164 family protein [Shinella sp. XGS7]